MLGVELYVTLENDIIYARVKKCKLNKNAKQSQAKKGGKKGKGPADIYI